MGYSENHNRSEGYADYRVDCFYISPDHLCIHVNDNRICPYLYLLTMQNRDNQKIQAMRNKNISKASSSKQFQRKFDDKFTRNKSKKLHAVKEDVKEEKMQNQKENNSKMRHLYNQTKIEILKAPKINPREVKRVIAQCLSGDYIPGLIYIEDFISEKEEIDIRQQIIENNKVWIWKKTNRKSLQFGWKLDYETKALYK